MVLGGRVIAKTSGGVEEVGTWRALWLERGAKVDDAWPRACKLAWES